MSFFYFRTAGYQWIAMLFCVAFMSVCVQTYQEVYIALGLIDTATGEKITKEADFWYFSLVTWTTLGYGDIRPTADARLYAASQAVLGYFYMSMLAAILFQWIGSVSQKAKR